jgi:tetratricopeptide (TPR) repeat protein
MQTGDLTGAIRDFTHVVDSPDIEAEHVFDALIGRGNAFRSMSKFEEALGDYSEAAEIEGIPEDNRARALVGQASALFNLERFDEALATSEKAIPIAASFPALMGEVLCIRGFCRFQSRDDTRACEDFTLIIDSPVSPKFWLASAYSGRSAIFRMANKLEEAAADLSSAVEAHELIAPSALRKLAEVHIKLLQYEKSLESVTRLLDLTEHADASDEQAQDDLGAVLTEVAYGLRENPAKWMPEIQRLLPALVERNLATGLSASIVLHLEKLKQSDLNNAAMDRWVSDWENVSRDYPQLQVGIRMLRSGVEWIKTKDESVLLDLVREERMIVRQALGLEPEAEE